MLNLDPTTLSAQDPRTQPPPPSPSTNNTYTKSRDRGYLSLGDYSPPNSPHTTFSSFSSPPTFPMPKPGKATPPPIDPGVFRSVTTIRRLIDEAAELSVRASSGLSAVALGSMRGGSAGINNNTPWATANSLGLNPLGDGGGRNVAMSAMRVHRLRALAVQKLAQAYKTDEIASSVMVMQGGSVFDDVAERVLKYGMWLVQTLAVYHIKFKLQIQIISMPNMCISSMKKYLHGPCSYLRRIVTIHHFPQATSRVYDYSDLGRACCSTTTAFRIVSHSWYCSLFP